MRMVIGRMVTVAILFAASWPGSLGTRGQETCSEVLRRGRGTVARFAADLSEAGGGALRLQIGRLTWQLVRAQLTKSVEPENVAHFNTDDVAHDLRVRARRDTAWNRLAAEALAMVMIGPAGGNLDAQSIAAADVYRAWNLTPGPALALLADPKTSARARYHAVEALRSRWAERSFPDAAAPALCVLAARSEGLGRYTEPDSQEVADVLDSDDLALLLRLETALSVRADSRSNASVRASLAVLPRSNPVTRHVARALVGHS
jgi:hypothetical protein